MAGNDAREDKTATRASRSRAPPDENEPEKRSRPTPKTTPVAVAFFHRSRSMKFGDGNTVPAPPSSFATVVSASTFSLSFRSGITRGRRGVLDDDTSSASSSALEQVVIDRVLLISSLSNSCRLWGVCCRSCIFFFFSFIFIIFLDAAETLSCLRTKSPCVPLFITVRGVTITFDDDDDVAESPALTRATLLLLLLSSSSSLMFSTWASTPPFSSLCKVAINQRNLSPAFEGL